MKLALFDTNILLRLLQSQHPQHSAANMAQLKIVDLGYRPCLIPQVIIEFRSVSTRPLLVNGLGMTQNEADAEIARLLEIHLLFEDRTEIFDEWRSLVSIFGAQGKQNHDARIVAAMNVHKIDAILTFNSDDFERYTGIEVMNPVNVIQPSG